MPQGSKITARPTLKTIAELSGLAVPTVSRALNDAPDIGQATKERVQGIARDLGYRPNRAGLRLRTGKTNVIALVISTEHDIMNHTARLITSIAAATRDTPYHMVVTPYFPDQDPMEPVRYVTETRSADGIILNQTQPDDPRVAYLMETGFPFATHGRTSWADQHPYCDFHNGVFAELCVRRLAECDRRTLLMIAPRRDQFYAQEMIAAGRAEAARRGVLLELLDQASSDDTADAIETGIVAHMAGAPGIDGIICASTNAAMAATAGLETRGLVLGRDVDVIVKGATSFLERFRKDILVVDEDVSRAGAFLGRAVMQAIDRPDLPPLQLLERPET